MFSFFHIAASSNFKKGHHLSDDIFKSCFLRKALYIVDILRLFPIIDFRSSGSGNGLSLNMQQATNWINDDPFWWRIGSPGLNELSLIFENANGAKFDLLELLLNISQGNQMDLLPYDTYKTKDTITKIYQTSHL